MSQATAKHDGPVAWLHTLHMEQGQTFEKITTAPHNAYGTPGRDYSEEYTVTSEPLFKGSALTDLQAELDGLREALAIAREWVEGAALACGYHACTPESCASKRAEIDLATIDQALSQHPHDSLGGR